ncbi:MAG: hypothetical protein ACI861_002006 [Paracoccaceae bacterium]|jgi:uncharacterized protein YjiS (DUF1127 family)
MTITATNTVSFGAFEIFELTNKKANLLASLRNWTQVRATRKVLSKLSVTQLDDIGLDGAGLVSSPVHFGRV